MIVQYDPQGSAGVCPQWARYSACFPAAALPVPATAGAAFRKIVWSAETAALKRPLRRKLTVRHVRRLRPSVRRRIAAALLHNGAPRDSLGESCCVGGSDAQTYTTKIPHNELERV